MQSAHFSIGVCTRNGHCQHNSSRHKEMVKTLLCQEMPLHKMFVELLISMSRTLCFQSCMIVNSIFRQCSSFNKCWIWKLPLNYCWNLVSLLIFFNCNTDYFFFFFLLFVVVSVTTNILLLNNIFVPNRCS